MNRLPNLGVYAGLVQHTGTAPDPMQDAQSTGAKWGYVAGIPAGFVLGKTLLSSHPILFGIGLIVAGSWLATRGLFTRCNAAMFGDGCYDAHQQPVPCNDPSAILGCERDGAMNGGLAGAGLGCIAAGSLLAGGILLALIVAAYAYDRHQAALAAAQDGAPPDIPPGQTWSTTYQNRAVTIQNVVGGGAYMLTVYDAPAFGNAVFQGVYSSPQEAWSQATSVIDKSAAPAVMTSGGGGGGHHHHGHGGRGWGGGWQNFYGPAYPIYDCPPGYIPFNGVCVPGVPLGGAANFPLG